MNLVKSFSPFRFDPEMSRKEDEFYKQVFTEFIEVLIHQIVFIHKIYPDIIFESRKKFNIPVKMSTHPWVNDYIESVMTTIKKQLTKDDPDFDSLEVIIADQGDFVLRRYKLEFCHLLKRDHVFNPENFQQRTELSLASMLLRLDSMTSDDDEVRRNEERSHQWWVELGCEVRGARRLMEDRAWCLASGLGRDEDRDILPVMGFHAPFTCQLYIEKSATTTRT